MAATPDQTITALTGRCYCGKTTLIARQKPQAVVYCHCIDCRRVTGAPVAAFAAFDEKDVAYTPNEGCSVSVNSGVERTFCASCGSPLTGRYDYLPGQIYIPISILDQANELAPSIHTQTSERLPWFHIDDDLEHIPASGRSQLNKVGK